MSKNQKIIFALIIIAFIVSRFFGLGQIYHQDEYRWATIANPVFDQFSSSPHPVFAKYVFRFTGDIFGYDNLRIAPLVFGFLGLILIFLVVRKLTNSASAGLVAMFFYAISVYSAIANLQVDIDGAFLPFFVLLGYYAYLNLKIGSNKKIWWLMFIVAVVGGFLTKISFVLFLGALAIDYCWDLSESKKIKILPTLRKYNRLLLVAIFLAGAGVYAYINLQHNVIVYAEHFKSLNFASRAYFELAFKVLKSFVWLSPLLLLSVVAGLFDKEIFNRNRFWFVYLVVNFFFYTILFDFTRLTIERYFMFSIVPAVIVSSIWVYKMFKVFKPKHYFVLIISSIFVFTVLSFVILSLNSAVLPLDPKTEYVQQAKYFDFNFLIPFTGGSGPVGFYFSALYILIVWLVCLVLLFGAYLNKKIKHIFLVLFLVFGTGYNVLFLNEYLFGSIYGSVPNIAKKSADYVLSNPDISGVITYYDIGAYDLKLGNKYLSRFYTAVTRDYTQKLSTYKGYYMIVDFPAIDKHGRYWPYLERCHTVEKFSDKKVDAYIFDCANL